MGPESEVNLMIFSNLLIVLNEASNDTRNSNLVCLVLETSWRSNIREYFL